IGVCEEVSSFWGPWQQLFSGVSPRLSPGPEFSVAQSEPVGEVVSVGAGLVGCPGLVKANLVAAPVLSTSFRLNQSPGFFGLITALTIPGKREHTLDVYGCGGGVTVKTAPIALGAALVLAAGLIAAPDSALAQRSGGAFRGGGGHGAFAGGGSGRAFA